jgi:diguanylate cyclase (GGDEF)-like protein
MLTYAIGFIQNTQLASFAIVFILMSIRDKGNRSIRWLAYTYISGLVGGVLQFATRSLPAWASVGLFMEAAPIGFACIYICVAHFVGRGWRTRWVFVALIAASLPYCLVWSDPARVGRIITLTDLVLALETILIAWLLLSTRDAETLWPRRVMAAFLVLYAAVESGRVFVFLHTGKTADLAAPWIEVASGMVYVISCSVLPLAIIWMMNARLHAHMERQMTSDSLTQLLNRRGLQEAGERELSRYLRRKQEFAVVLLDIDHFKRLNDTFGHAGGDIVLREIASLFRDQLRDSDTIGRLGGEEFVLLLPVTSSEGASQLVERLRLTMEDHTFQLDHRQTKITASFGITTSRGRGDLSWDVLLNEADIALYAAKDAGRNLTELYREDLSSPRIAPPPGESPPSKPAHPFPAAALQQ